MIRALLLLVGLALAAPAAAQAPEPGVTWDPAAPDIGDIIMLTVEIDVPENLLVTFPRLDGETPGFEITGRLGAEPEQNVTGQRRWRQSYRIEPQSTGRLLVPDAVIVVHDPETLAETRVPLSGVAIPVNSLVPAETDHRNIKDVRGMLRLPSPVRETTFWPWIALAVIAVVAVALWRLGRRGPAAILASSTSPRDAALTALTGLDPKAGDGEANDRFHTELSGILRTYLDQAFAIAAPRRTTTEAIAALRARGTGDADLLAPALKQCDRVKFARGAPGADARERALAAVRNFVSAGSAPAEGI